MSRVKRGNISRKRHKKILKLAKGFRASLSKLYRPAHQTVLHALTSSYRDRRRKKRTFKSLWIVRMNASLDEQGVSYSKFMGFCKTKNIGLNKKMFADIALNNPENFKEIVNFVQS